MAQAALHKCNAAGCNVLTRERHCDRHAKEKQQWTRGMQSRESQQLYGWRWSKASKQFIREHPLCVECEGRGKTTASHCTDHIVPHRGNEVLFWDEDNWQALCRACHDAKTRRGE